MNTPAKISVITPSFNQGEFIAQTVESVLSQNYPNFEHIIMDGGSTDETLSVLARYPHLTVISEQDRGQSHAINKALNLATGDIIAWINSDDWYEPGIFTEIAKALEEYPIVMGECGVTDRNGNVQEIATNREHSWYDLLKYWVYHSVPAQPGIFFKKKILDDIRYENGDVLDEDLDFCMDWDLWLRIAKRYPLMKRIPKVFAYARMYESNKTGAYPEAVNREWKRVFRRYAQTAIRGERTVTLMHIIDGSPEAVEKSAASVSAELASEVEILCVDITADPKGARSNKKAISAFAEKFPHSTVRYTRSHVLNPMAALSHGIASACSPYVAYIKQGVSIEAPFITKIKEVFAQDCVACVISRNDCNWGAPQFLPPDASFQVHTSLPSFAIRKVAWLELNGFQGLPNEDACRLIGYRQLLLRLYQRGWRTCFVGGLFNNEAALTQEESAMSSVFGSYVNASILKSIQEERAHDPFIVTREEHGFSVAIPQQLVEAAQRLLDRAPENWYAVSGKLELDALRTMTTRYPSFSPGWYQLAQATAALSLAEDSARAMHSFNNNRSQEALI